MQLAAGLAMLSAHGPVDGIAKYVFALMYAIGAIVCAIMVWTLCHDKTWRS